MTYIFIFSITNDIVILSTINITCIQEIPKHIITKYIIGSNSIIVLGCYIATLERIRLNQIQFLRIASNVISSRYLYLSPGSGGAQGKHQEQEEQAAVEEVSAISGVEVRFKGTHSPLQGDYQLAYLV